jgi:hypothetical protein
MLLANAFEQAVGTGFGWMIVFVAVVIICAKKFANANPEVKDAAKKAAAAKAIQLIGRLFK